MLSAWCYGPGRSSVFSYNLVIIAQNYLERLVHVIIGGHEGQFWVRWEPVYTVVQDALVEPIRLCLLAVAFRRCLELFAQRSPATAPPTTIPEPTPPVMATAKVGS